MEIDDIEPTLMRLVGRALDELSAPAEATSELAFEKPPSPEMGDLGLPCFPLARHLERPPPAIADELAAELETVLRRRELSLVGEVDSQGPYVNVEFEAGPLARLVVSQALDSDAFGSDRIDVPERWNVEFSAPNTNKPQHLGHVRNDLLGETVSTIAEFAGHDVVRVNLINDRGIHICKSMVAYRLDEDPQTPAETGKKGDHLVGEYYVEFADKLQDEYAEWLETDEADAALQQWLDQPEGRRAREEAAGADELRAAFADAFEEDFFNEYSEYGARAQQMLRAWERGDDQVRALWETMNGWVVEGFEETYDRLGVAFDRIDWESETYEAGREVVERGLEEGLFERKEDGAVVFDLERIGMEGEKVVLRSDGTAVYVTQDLGTALRRRDERDFDRMIYVVGDEQDYHFDVLFGILEEIDSDLEGRLDHLSYGMVDLPSGRMKSREGEVIDADDLMDELVALAEGAVRDRHGGLDDDEVARRAEVIGMAALKFDILDYNPRTRVQFDPEQSIQFEGRTGPYCLYTYARVQSIGREVDGGWPDLDAQRRDRALEALGTDRELAVVRELATWPATVDGALADLDPGDITEYLFELARAFSSLYNDPDHRIVDLDRGPRRDGLLLLCRAVAETMATGLELLGIETLDQM